MDNIELGLGCYLTDVESHFENGVRVIDNFKFNSVSLVANPTDDNCILYLTEEGDESDESV